MQRTFLSHILHQVETHSNEHAHAAKQSSDLLGGPDWHQISKLTSLEVHTLLHKYASLRSMRGSTEDIETGPAACKSMCCLQEHVLLKSETRQQGSIGGAGADKSVCRGLWRWAVNRVHVKPGGQQDGSLLKCLLEATAVTIIAAHVHLIVDLQHHFE